MASPNLPFKRGQTYYGGAPTDSEDGNALLGQEYTMVDDTYGTGREIVLRVVKNSIGTTAAVFGKTLAKLNALGTEITGIAVVDADRPVALIDEKLPSGGCAKNDLCYVVVKGPALGKSQIAAGVATTPVAAGDLVNAVTLNQATTASTTAGRIKTRALSSAVTAAQLEAEGVIGRAISSIATSGVTDTGILIDVYPVF